MKSLLALLFVSGLWNSCLMAQTPVVLSMEQMLGDQPFAHEITSEADLGYYFNVTRLQYYISEITLIHDGGERTPVTDLHFLVDPAKDSIFPLGSFPVTDLEQIEFWIGVDSAHNHLDPATYPVNHPLAPQDPSMHWGWAAGYRFIAFEGFAGESPGLLPSNYEIHTIGNENYRKILVTTDETYSGDSLIIPVRADYAQLLHKVDASLGLSSHSSSGPSNQIAQNMGRVFTPLLSGSADQTIPEQRLVIYPNPARYLLNIFYPFSGNRSMTLTLTDLQGRIVMSEIISSTNQAISIKADMHPGLYIATLTDGLHIQAIEKVVVR